MKPSLKAGLKHRFAYQVPETKTVPHLYRRSAASFARCRRCSPPASWSG